MIFEGLFKSLYENPILIVDALLKELNIKVLISTIDDTLHKHSDYPIFLSISDSLSSMDNVKLNMKNSKIYSHKLNSKIKLA